MRLAHRQMLIPLLAFGMVACVTRADLEEIKKNQQDTIAAIKAIKMAPGPQRPTPQQPQVARPDPAKTYGFPVGDSAAMGPKDAWVTIVGVSDFQ